MFGWLVMARKGKDTDVTVTVKTEDEWNNLIESKVPPHSTSCNQGIIKFQKFRGI